MIIGLHAQSRIMERMIETFEKSGADAVIALGEVARSDVVHYGIAQPRGRIRPIFELADVIEKPRVEEATSRLAVAGRYVFGPSIFQLLEETRPHKNGEILLTDAIRALIAKGEKWLACVWLPANGSLTLVISKAISRPLPIRSDRPRLRPQSPPIREEIGQAPAQL